MADRHQDRIDAKVSQRLAREHLNRQHPGMSWSDLASIARDTGNRQLLDLVEMAAMPIERLCR
jgi:hypothetical protein